MDHREARFRDTFALVFASFFPLGMACIYFLVLDDPARDANPAVMATYTGGKVLQFLFPIVYVWWFCRSEICLKRPTWHGMPLSAGFAVFVAMAMFVLYSFVIHDVPGVSDQTPLMIYSKLKQSGQHTPVRFVFLGVFLCGIHSLAEEYYWRWFVFGTMRKHLALAPSILLSSIGFMLHHVVILYVYFPGNFWMLALPLSLCVAFGGGMWAWIYERSGTLYAPWLSHALIDAAIMTLGYRMLSPYWE